MAHPGTAAALYLNQRQDTLTAINKRRKVYWDESERNLKKKISGAGSGNRTRVTSLEG